MRCCGVRSTLGFLPGALSKNTVPFTTIFPESGRSIPAIDRMVRLLPQPDAPKRPSVSVPAENALCSSKPLNFLRMSTSRLIYFCSLLRYFVVWLDHRLMNTMTIRLNTMMTSVQNHAVESLPFIHSK